MDILYEMTFPCDSCAKEFTAKNNLYRHQRRFHAQPVNEDNVATNEAVVTLNALPLENQPIASVSTVPDEPSAAKRPRCYIIVDDDHIFGHGKEVLECDVCEMYFLAQEELNKHIKVRWCVVKHYIMHL